MGSEIRHRDWLWELIMQSGWHQSGDPLEMPEHGWCWIGLYDFTGGGARPDTLNCISEEMPSPEYDTDALPNHYKFHSLHMGLNDEDIPS